MSTILVVDDMAVFREPIAAALRAKGYETICASDGREALGIVKTGQPDLVLLDVAMPIMDGLEFLKALNADATIPRPPVILLTAVAEKSYVLQAAQLGVNDYLLKSQFSLEELAARVQRRLSVDDAQASMCRAAAAVPQADDPEGAAREEPAANLKSLKPIMKRAEVVECLEKCGELKALPPSVTEVLKRTRNARCSLEQIAKPIKQDPAIAIKILKLANSSVYSRGQPVESVEHALTRIGLDMVRQVMLNISVIDQFRSVSIVEHVPASHFWEHSIACGIVAAEIAHARGANETTAAFTMGLVHDVGRLIFAKQLGEDYQNVVHAARDLCLPLERVESRMLLLNHADGMDRLLHKWHFSKEFIDPVVFHHLSVANIRKATPHRVDDVATLALANRLCHALMLGNSGNEAIYQTEEFCDVLELDAEVIQRIEQTARDETETLKLGLLAMSDGDAWQDCRERHRSALTAPFRSLFVSARPEFDAFRIFCDQLGERSGEPPNIGIVHLTATNECERVTQDYVSTESQSGVDRLPLIILSPKAELKLKDRVMANRQHELLPTPIVIARFIEAINRSLSGDQPKQYGA
ncbi:MAG: HDOD domain-containing protein [Phycisphaerales bacterium]